MARHLKILVVFGSALFVTGLFAGSHLLPPTTLFTIAQPAHAQPGQPSAEEMLKKLKLRLPPVTPPKNTYVPAVRVGNMLYVSGTGPQHADGKPWIGQLGKTMTLEEGNKAARQVGLRVLGVVKKELGSLNKVVRVVKTLGMVNAAPDFTQHPQVVNGFSDLMVEVFGEEAGTGARSAVGMSSLPGGIAVEIETMFQVRP